jgi:hypothetical protein
VKARKEEATRKADVGGRIILKMDLEELGWGRMDLNDLVQNIDQWKVLVSDNEPSGSIKCWEILE